MRIVSTRARKSLLVFAILVQATITIAQPSGWDYIPGDFGVTMEVDAQVLINDVPVTQGWLGAFNGDICHGLVEASYFSLRDHYVFILLFGGNNAGEEISFRYSPDGVTEYNIEETILFEIEGIIGSAGSPFPMHVDLPNNPPIFSSTPITSVLEDLAYSYTAAADDLDGDILTYDAPVRPSWLSFNPTSRELSGNPTQAEVGVHDVTLSVFDGEATIYQIFTVTVTNVNDAPTFTSTALLSATQDQAYSYTATAFDAEGDGMTFSAPVLPFWMSFNASTHVLSGTPDNSEVANHNVTLRVSDGSAFEDQVFIIAVGNVNDAPTFLSTEITSSLEGVAYEYTVTAEDIDGDVLTYSAPVLPSWMSFNSSTHILSGTPGQTEVGNHNVTLRINDGFVNVDQIFIITVDNENDAPTFSSTPITDATEDVAYSYTATADDIDGDALSFTATTLPGWLTFNTTTHVLSGTPVNENVGDHPVTLQVGDGFETDIQSFTIAVSNVNDAPTFTNSAPTSATEDAAYSYTVIADDAEGDGIIYSAPDLPGWMSFVPATRILSGTPGNDEVGDHNVTLRVSDGIDFTDQVFVIGVVNVNDAPEFSSTSILTATEELAYTYTATATDIDVGDVLTLSAPVLPSWLTFVPASGVLSGTPGNGDVGNHNVTLRVSDATVTVDQVFIISVDNVNDAPLFNSTPILIASEEILYSYTATAVDIDVGDLLTLSAPLLPDWLSFVPASGILSGTPGNDEVGNHNVTLRVNDGTVSVDQQFIINVSNVNDAPTFTSTEITSVLEDQLYSYTVIAEDIDGDALTYSAPERPAWLSYNTTSHVLSGTPDNDQVGNHDITLRINDGTVSVDQVFVINVVNVNDAPTFTSTPILSASEEVAYSYTAIATDIDVGDNLIFSAPDLPSWMTFNPSTRLLNGTPLNGDVGDHNVTLRINDGTVTVDQSFIISVNNTNDTPTFTSIPLTSVLEDEAYSYTATAEDIDGDALTFSAPTMPGWLTFNTSSHLLSGTPGNGDVGNHNVTLQINDGTVLVTQVFVINVTNVNDLPVFSTSPLTTALEGTLYEYTAAANDIDVGAVLTYTAPLLPDWLNFNASTHVLSGTPENGDVGNHNVTLRVNDGTADVDQAFVITVSNENDAPTFTSTPLLTATEELAYSYTASANDIDGDMLSFSAPLLPGWLIFNATSHVLSGTPDNDDVGNHNVTLRVSDGIVFVNQEFIVNVSNVNDAPEFISSAITSVNEDASYSYTVIAEDIDGDVLTYSAPVLPPWLSFNASTHLLSGVPGNAQVGNHNVTLRITDGFETVNQVFVIMVSNVNDEPEFTSTAITTATEDVSYLYTATAEDIEGDALTFSAPVLPGWLSFNASTHILSGVPGNDEVGNHNVSLRVSDGTASVNQEFVITVDNVNDAPTFTSTALTTATEDLAYSYTATAEDIDGDNLSFTAPLIPGWLTFNASSHELSGIPGNDDVGNHSITLRVSDGTVSVDQQFIITVSNVNDAPTFTSVELTSVLEDVAYSYTASAEDVDGDGLTFSAPVLPGWLTFNASSRLLSGVPGNDEVGVHNVSLRVSDGTVSVNQVFIITVTNVNDAPAFTSTALTAATEDLIYNYTATAEDIDGDALTYSAPVLPGWLIFNTSTHLLSGTPGNGEVGVHIVRLRIADGTTTSDQVFAITVSNVNDAPAFTSTPITSALEDLAYVYTVTAEDIDGDALTFSAPVLPSWLAFNTSTHVLSGTPGNEDLGLFNVTIRISDASVVVDQVFAITVDNENDAPAFTSTPVTTARQGIVYEYTAAAEDIDGDVLAFSATVLPSWLTFNAVTHVLSGTPPGSAVGNQNVSLRISDGFASVDQSFTIVVVADQAPNFTSTPLTTSDEDVLFSYTVSATDPEGDPITYSAPVLPSWMTFNTSTRLLSGTPDNDQVGTHNITIRVSDGIEYSDQAFILTVVNINDVPVFTSVPLTTINEDEAYSYTAIVNDIDGDVLSFSAPVRPAWLTFNTSSHLLSGTPDNDDVGTHNITIRVSDGTVVVNQPFVITVDNVNDAPVFTSTPVTGATQGALYSYTATAEDVDGDAISYIASVLPGWLNFNSSTHVLSGTPENSDVGSHNLTLRISDGTVSTDQVFIITVGNENDAPVFTSTPITTASQDLAYLYIANASDIDGDALSFSAPVRPGWLTFNASTRLLSGIPDNNNVGIHNVTLRVSDGTVTVDQQFVITVNNVNDSPTFTTVPVTTAVQGTLYSYTSSAADVDGDDISFIAAELPAWLSFNSSTHVLRGTPGNSDVGNHNVTLRISDGTVSVDQVFVITVANENDAPEFTSTPVNTATEDALYSYTAEANDVDGNTLTFSAPTLPGWLTFNASSRLLSGTPENDDVGMHNVTLRVSDGTVSVNQPFIITVINENDAPLFTSVAPATASEGITYTYTANADDIDGDALTYIATVLPGWLTFNASTHVLSGIPARVDEGMHNVTIRVNDGTVSVDQSFTISVTRGNTAPKFTSTPVTAILEGSTYTYQVVATDADGDPLTFTATNIPDWMIFNATTQILSGLPEDADIGAHNVTLSVFDGRVSVNQYFIVAVDNANDAPEFISIPVVTALEGLSYSYTIVATDIDGDALSFTAHVLPSWLTFDASSQLLSGTPENEDVGNHNVSVRVTDGTIVVDQSFVITVFNENDSPYFTSEAVTSAVESEAYEYTVTAEDPDSDELSYSASELPAWSNFNEGTHILSGTPSFIDAGSYNVTINVSDGIYSVDQSFTILVAEKRDVANGIDDDAFSGKLSIYPNPTDSRFIVELKRSFEENTIIEIIDASGKLLYQHSIPANSEIYKAYNLSDLPAGIYYIRLRHDKGAITDKLVIY